MPSFLDVVGNGVAITGGGLIATSTVNATGARTSFGRNTGKFLVRGTILSGGFTGNSAVNFGFMSSGGSIDGQHWGNTGSPAGTSFSIGHQGRFIGSNAMYRFHSGTNVVYILTYKVTITFAVNLDTQRFWFNTSDGSSDTGWQYDDGSATPASDPTLAVGTSYASYITASTTIYPGIYLESIGNSGSMDFTPTAQPLASGFAPWIEAAPTGGGWIDPKVVRDLLLRTKAYHKSVEDERAARDAKQEAMFATIERAYDEIAGKDS